MKKIPEKLIRKVKLLKWRLPKPYKSLDINTLLENLEIDVEKTLKKLEKTLKFR